MSRRPPANKRLSAISSRAAPEGRRLLARYANPWDDRGLNNLTSPGETPAAQLFVVTRVRPISPGAKEIHHSAIHHGLTGHIAVQPAGTHVVRRDFCPTGRC